MSYLKVLTKMSFILALLFTYGCASIDTAPAELDAAAKKFDVNPEASQVYIYRNQTLGAALSMPVTVNGKSVGNTGPKSFFKLDLPAGTHTITSQGDKSTLDIETELGKNYFVWQQVKMGLMSGGSKLQIVDEEKGKKGVSQCKLIESNL